MVARSFVITQIRYRKVKHTMLWFEVQCTGIQIWAQHHGLQVSSYNVNSSFDRGLFILISLGELLFYETDMYFIFLFHILLT